MGFRRLGMGILVLGIAVIAGSCGREAKTSLPPVSFNFLLKTVDGDSVRVSQNSLNEGLRNLNFSNGDILRLPDTQGQLVTIPRSEIEIAFQELLASKHKIFKTLFVNGDGSVTLTSPRFLYRDQSTALMSADLTLPAENLASSPPLREESLIGICRHFGFSRFLLSEEYASNNDYRPINEARGNPGSVLTSSGEIAKYFDNAYATSYASDQGLVYYRVIQSITCADHID